MLFEILDEKPLTEAASDPVAQAIELLNSVSEQVKGVLVENIASHDFDETAIKSSDPITKPILNWADAEKVADNNEKNTLARAYSLIASSKYPQYTMLLDNAEDIWTHIINNLGYTFAENPFLRYVYYYKHFEPATIRSQLITLNNLYSSSTSDGRSEDKVISAKDLNQSDSILYNPNLWRLSIEDATIIVTKYNYAKYHRKLYSHPSSISTISTQCKPIYTRVSNALSGTTDYESIPLEKYIVFTDGTNAVTCSIEKAAAVQEYVDKYFTGAAVDRLKKEIKPSEKTRSSLDRNKQDALRKFIKDSGIRARDVKDVALFLSELVDLGELR